MSFTQMHRNIYEGRLQNVCHCNLQRTREPPSESTPLHSSLAVHYPLFSINIFALAAVCAVCQWQLSDTIHYPFYCRPR